VIMLVRVTCARHGPQYQRKDRREGFYLRLMGSSSPAIDKQKECHYAKGLC